MPTWSVICSAFVRLFIAVLPKIPWFNRYRDFALRGNELKEAKELLGYQQSRLIILSWPPLALLEIFTQVDQVASGVQAMSTFILFLVCAVICFLVLLIPPRSFRLYLGPFITFLTITLVDVLFQLFGARSIAKLISIPSTGP